MNIAIDADKVINRAKELKHQGISYRESAKVMNSEGFKTVTGMPLTQASISYYLTRKKSGNVPQRSQITHTASQTRTEFSSLMYRIYSSSLQEKNKTIIMNVLLDDMMNR